MRSAFAALIVVFALVGTAAAQSALDAATGTFGDMTDPETSCAVNPHRVDVMVNPPHLTLTWSSPVKDETGRLRRSERYDLLDATDTSLILRLEGETRRTGAGERPTWIFRPTPDGYCWGREDWPLVRCERPQQRCEKPLS